jgi:hypothetical protein
MSSPPSPLDKSLNASGYHPPASTGLSPPFMSGMDATKARSVIACGPVNLLSKGDPGESCTPDVLRWATGDGVEGCPPPVRCLFFPFIRGRVRASSEGCPPPEFSAETSVSTSLERDEGPTGLRRPTSLTIASGWCFSCCLYASRSKA